MLRFGEYSRTLPPGINLTMPRPVEDLIKVNVSNVRSMENRGQMLTQDENIVDLNYSVQYRVSDAQQFLFRVRDPEETLREAAESETDPELRERLWEEYRRYKEGRR